VVIALTGLARLGGRVISEIGIELKNVGRLTTTFTIFHNCLGLWSSFVRKLPCSSSGGADLVKFRNGGEFYEIEELGARCVTYICNFH
jgi:hypothetical protein